MYMSDPSKPVKGKRTVSGHLDWKTTFCNFEGPGGVFFEHPSHGIRRAVLEPRVLRIICSFWGASYEASWHFKAVPDHHFGGIWWYLLIFPAFLHGIWWYLLIFRAFLHGIWWYLLIFLHFYMVSGGGICWYLVVSANTRAFLHCIWWYLLIFPAFLHGIWWWYLVVSGNIPCICIFSGGIC